MFSNWDEELGRKESLITEEDLSQMQIPDAQVLLQCAPGMKTLNTSGSVANSEHSTLGMNTVKIKAAAAADSTRWCCEEITEAFYKQSFKWEGLLW